MLLKSAFARASLQPGCARGMQLAAFATLSRERACPPAAKRAPRPGPGETTEKVVSREHGCLGRSLAGWSELAHMLASALVLWPGWVMLHKHELVLAWPTKYREANMMNCTT
jgi:hypothetical protein